MCVHSRSATHSFICGLSVSVTVCIIHNDCGNGNSCRDDKRDSRETAERVITVAACTVCRDSGYLPQRVTASLATTHTHIYVYTVYGYSSRTHRLSPTHSRLYQSAHTHVLCAVCCGHRCKVCYPS